MMQLISQSVPGVLNMTYNYSATQNNGRITSSLDGITGENTAYTYDALNRLTAASNSLWSTSYGYDGFGNLTSKLGSGGSPNAAPTMSATYNANNQQNGVYYDANGNQGDWGGSVYGGNTYSVENRLTWEVLSSEWPYPANAYAYDPWGKRVMNGSDPSPYGSPDPTYNYNFYGITGQKLVTLTCNGSSYPSYPTCEISQNAYFGKKLIVSGGVNVVTDRLGSVRANSYGESFAYYPYGEERTSTVDGRDKFGTYFRDMVGQDYADQRYYGSGTGRYWSVDRGPVRLKDSASWNRYAYVEEDPVNHNDPTGKLLPAPSPVVPWEPPDTPTDSCLFDPMSCDPFGTGAEYPFDPQGGGTGYFAMLKQVYLAPAVAGAVALLSQPSCDGLFGNAVYLDPASLLESAYENNQIRFYNFGSDIDPSVGAQTGGTGDTGIIQIAANRYFVTGVLSNGQSLSTTPGAFNGLSLLQSDELILIHELLHLAGVVGDDSGTQTITLPNGDTVTGSAGVSNEVRKDCIGK
jgi:RHS repeat-associated protein